MDRTRRARGAGVAEQPLRDRLQNPLDTAILAAAQGPADAAAYRKLAELPYDFKRRCLERRRDPPATGRPCSSARARPKPVLARSTQARGAAIRTAAARCGRRGRSWRAQIAAAAALGQRAIAVATRSDGVGPTLDAADERDLVFEGVLLFSDPPKADIAATLQELRTLGVALHIVTGDNELVARPSPGQVGLPCAASSPATRSRP